MDIIYIKKLLNSLSESPFEFVSVKLLKHVLTKYESGIINPHRILDKRLMLHCDRYETSDNRYYRNMLELMVNGRGVLTIQNQNKEKSEYYNRTAKFIWILEQIYKHQLPQDAGRIKILLISIVKLIERFESISVDLTINDHLIMYLYKYIHVLFIDDSLLKEAETCMLNVNPFVNISF